MLGNVEYKLNLARVDKVLAAAFKYHSRYEFKCLDVEEVPFRLWGALLPLCGSTIRHVETKNDENISPPYELIGLYCPNLESVQWLSEISHIVIRIEDGKRTVTFLTEEFEYQ
ncbi:hypothetical protein M5D96_005825 [Drosophila gunungcola]|uniref:Uncharacterized protein n=1 Tax=Drosophila gunungcola TaxID=103775 RepID=A0A9P9YQZ3_9MUSC|nr:hypothetical protein M5D96_005825 [Drosophila gunungcola]